MKTISVSKMTIVGIGISLTFAEMVSVVVTVSYKSLGGGIKSLGDGVKTGAGTEGNMSSIYSMVSISGISKTTKTISVSKMTIVGISISLTFAKMVSVVVSISYKSLGR